MKRLTRILASLSVIFILFPACAQHPSHFDNTWNEVDSLKKQGLPQSAIKLVDKVYHQAKTESNQPQVIKAILYKMSLQGDFEENHLEKAIRQLTEELSTTETPEREILHSLLAELIQRYYDQNRWKILQRTTILGNPSEDMQTWDAIQFEQYVRSHYQLSLENKDKLKALPLKDFQAIVTEYDNNLWPTVYDLLANRALLYFSTTNGDFKKAPEPLLPSESSYLTKAATFVGLPVDANALGENHALVLKLFQQLLDFHLTSNNSPAFIDLDLRRLTYVYQQSVQNSGSGQQYVNALRHLIASIQDKKALQKTYYTLAEAYFNNGQNYHAESGDSLRYELVESAIICNQALKLYTDSTQKAPFSALLQHIMQKSFLLTTDEVLLPGKPALASLEFRNVGKLYFKVIRIDVDAELKSNIPQRNRMIQYLKEEAVLNFSHDLPDTRDHQSHTTLISIPALNKGQYALFVSDDPDFSQQSTISFETLWVSELSYILKENSNTGGGELYVLDRVTGKPVSGVDIVVYQSQYVNKNRSYETLQVGQLLTDKEGYAAISAFKDVRYGNYTFVFHKGDDVLASENYLRFYKVEKQSKPDIRTYLFTDRAIYRPGQTIYYKGIVVSRLKEEISLAKDR
ncbi:MAG: hypothetical protein WC341_14410, partial [Bacteroidales bacterium]